MQKYESAYLGDYINNEFVKPRKADGDWKVVSPADLKDEIMGLSFSSEHVDRACQAAREAFPKWAALKTEERAQYLLRLKEIYSQHKNELAEVISRSSGKPLWEGINEAQVMINKIDITINDSAKLVQTQHLPNALPGVDGYIRFKPRGVMVVLGPFNFPGHLPNGHIVPALLTGNTVVFKPSEWTPLVGQFMAQLFQKAEFPKGVFNLVQGMGETGKKLVKNENVDGILMTGSYETGLRIKQETLEDYWKLLALEMGGKNTSIVWKDADFDKAVYENVIGSFISTGQRCSCTSRLMVHADIYDRFVEKFYNVAKKLTIGHWKENPFMGPLINERAVENYIRFQGIARREGAECLMRGKALEKTPAGHYVTPSIFLVDKISDKSVYQKTELFGPNIGIYKINSIEEAVESSNKTGFGLVMALFSKDKSLYEYANLHARVGNLNWNRTSVGASSKMPFGGLGKSGNDRPSAHFAVYYCTTPLSNLEDPTPFDSTKLYPGVTWE